MTERNSDIYCIDSKADGLGWRCYEEGAFQAIFEQTYTRVLNNLVDGFLYFEGLFETTLVKGCVLKIPLEDAPVQNNPQLYEFLKSKIEARQVA